MFDVKALRGAADEIEGCGGGNESEVIRAAAREIERLRHVIKRLTGQIEFMAEEKRQTEADRADTVRRAFPQFFSAPEATL